MAEQPRDWDRELADIDKIIATGGGAAPAGKPAARPASGAAPQSSPPARAPGGKAAVLGTWFRLVLAASLLAALAVWPFSKWCGSGLALYLAACGLGVVTSLWAAGASWSNRRGFAHVLGLLTLGGTLTLAGLEVLPRIGYAKETRTWLCVVPAPAAATPAPTAAPVPVQDAAPATAPIVAPAPAPASAPAPAPAGAPSTP